MKSLCVAICFCFFCCAFTTTAQQLVPWYINAKYRVDFTNNSKPQIVLLNNRLPPFFNNHYIEDIQYDYMGKFIIYNTYPMLFFDEQMDSIPVYNLYPDSLYWGGSKDYLELARNEKSLMLTEKDNRSYKFFINHYSSVGDSALKKAASDYNDTNGGIYYSRFISDGTINPKAKLDSSYGTRHLTNKNVYGLIRAKKKGGGYWIMSKTYDGVFYSYPVDSDNIGQPVTSSIAPIDTNFGKGTYYEKIDYSEKLHTLVCVRRFTNDSPFATNKYICQFIKYNFDNTTGLFTLDKYWMDYKTYLDKEKMWPQPIPGCFTPDDSFYITNSIYSRSIPFVAFNMHDIVLKPKAIGTCDKKYIKPHSNEVSNVAVGPDGYIYFFVMESDYFYLGKVTYPFDSCSVFPYYSSYPFTGSGYDNFVRPYPPDVFYEPHPIRYDISLDSCTKPLRAVFVNKSDTIYKQFTLYFGDGDSLTTNNKYNDTIIHYYNIAGKLNFTAKGVDALRFTAWLSDSIWVRAAPVIAKYGSFASLTCQKAEVQFTDLSKTDTINETGSHWYWDFGDSTDTTFTIKGLPNGRGSVNHRYDTSGHYAVKLIYDNGYCTDTFISPQQIYIAPTPRVGFDVDPKSGCVPQVFNITPSYKDSIQLEKYYIYYDKYFLKDSFINKSTKPTFPLGFVFNQKDSGGFITIKQILTGATGCINQYIDSIRIYTPPFLKLIKDTFICKDETLQISATSGYQYNWNTGDTSQSIIINKAGTYSVKVINGACMVSDSTIITQDLNESCKFRVSLFPNPCNSQFTVSLYSRKEQTVNIQLYEMSGKQVASYNNVPVNQFSNLVVDTENLAGAMYILQLNTNEKRYIFKVIKLIE